MKSILEDNPIIWKVLWGLAEARPALCYCSVILRGALAVQMAHWSSALTTSPKTLEATKKILWLMSVGQYLPPPLDSVAEVIGIFHPYQVLYHIIRTIFMSQTPESGFLSCLRFFQKSIWNLCVMGIFRVHFSPGCSESSFGPN